MLQLFFQNSSLLVCLHLSLMYIIYIYNIINIIYITIYITFMICVLLNPNRKGDFTLDRMEAECRGDIAFFCSCTWVKVLFTDTFLKCRFRWKVEIISTFRLWTNVAFFLNQSFWSVHVNKVSHSNMAYSQSTI